MPMVWFTTPAQSVNPKPQGPEPQCDLVHHASESKSLGVQAERESSFAGLSVRFVSRNERLLSPGFLSLEGHVSLLLAILC